MKEEKELRKSIDSGMGKLRYFEYIINDINYIAKRKENVIITPINSPTSDSISSNSHRKKKSWIRKKTNSVSENDNITSFTLHLNSLPQIDGRIAIQSIPPHILAEQISLINYRSFEKIRAREFFGYHTKNSEQNAKNIKKCIAEWKGLSACLKLALFVAVWYIFFLCVLLVILCGCFVLWCQVFFFFRLGL